MIDINQLEHLVTIADAGTISQASQILHISQPGLTRSIQRLEEELHVKLFDRRKNKITLNKNGILAVQYAREILNSVEKMTNNLRILDQSTRIISIASCAPAPMWGLTDLCHHLYPKNVLESYVLSNEKELMEGLDTLQYTMIVLNHPINNNQYICLKVIQENLFISIPLNHRLASFTEISFDDINGESILLLSDIGFWNKLCIRKLPDSRLLLQNDTNVFDELIKASTLPHFKTDITMLYDDNEENRISIPITDDDAHITYYLIMKKDTHHIFKITQESINKIDWHNL